MNSHSRSSDSHVPEEISRRADLPSRVAPMTGFRHDLPVRAYSGGTVRDLHTVPYSSGVVSRRVGHCELYNIRIPRGMRSTQGVYHISQNMTTP